jgi:thioredoxin reductase
MSSAPGTPVVHFGARASSVMATNEREGRVAYSPLYDAIIIGGGPAGLSAALVLGRCLRRIVVCDSGRYRNQRSTALHCFMSRDGIAPSSLLQEARRELERYDTVSMLAAKVTAIHRRGDISAS